MGNRGRAAADAERDMLIRRGLKLVHLRLMAALEETGQISGAASHLAMSQPAASRLLAELERSVGTKLYRRHPRGIVLNEPGSRLAARARRILRDLDAAGREISQIATGDRGRVNIGAVIGAALELVLPAIRQARVTYPEIEITVTVDTSDKLAEALLSGRIDFYIGRVPAGIEMSALHVQLIGHEPVSLIARTGHPLLNRPDITLADCLGYDWVMQPPGGLLRHTAELYLLERGHELPSRIVNTSSQLVTIAMIGSSNSIAPVARSAAEFYGGEEGLGGRIRRLPVADDMKVSPYSLVTERDRALGGAARTFHEMIASRLRASL